ncbi:MAG: acetate--CoA ligase family protein [Dehalococcoidales bacterium]|nr:acetate--CoA ligase family protein [Dehalococcoidales bacterium]
MNNVNPEEKILTLLNEVEAKDLLKEAGIPVVETRLARTRREAVVISREIGYPVAMKIISPDINHKTEAGGVKLDLLNASQVGKAYRDMMISVQENARGARIEGISIQKMAEPGVEIIVGMNWDAQFGQVLMFGLGGIFVEIMRDVSFRLIPVTPIDVAEMIQEIKGFPLLNGYRGQAPVNIRDLEHFILSVSEFIEAHPMIRELDLNPVIASPTRIMAVDARIIMNMDGE